MLMPAAAPASQRRQLLTASELGSALRTHMSGAAVNRWLLHFGWQRKPTWGTHYEPVGVGRQYGVLVERKVRDRTGRPCMSRQLRWSPDCVAMLEGLLRGQGVV